MKRISKFFAASIALAAVLTSCEQTEIVSVPEFRLAIPSDTETTLMAYGESTNYTYEATYFQHAAVGNGAEEIDKADRFNVYSNCSWRIEPAAEDQDWVQPYPETGGDKEGQIFFRIDRNNDQYNDRTAYFKFILNDGEKDIEVGGYFIIHQDKAVDFLKTSIVKSEISNAGGTQKIRVRSNKQWAYILEPMEEYATAPLEEWLVDNTVHPADQMVDTLSFKLPNNSEGAIRGFNVKIVCPENGTLNTVIPITQLGADVEIDGFPVQWIVGVKDNNYASTWPSSGIVNSIKGKGTIKYNNEAGKAVDVNGKCLFDVSGNCPRVTGAWPGDYCEFTADAPVPGGSIMKISFETRTSATNPKYWMLYYLDGTEWKIASPVLTTEVEGKPVEYTHAMEADGSTNIQVSQTVRYANSTDQCSFRFVCQSPYQANGAGVLAAPNGGTWRLAVTNTTSEEWQPTIQCVAAGAEEIIYGNISASTDLLTFEGTPEAPQTFTVTADQDFSIYPTVSWLSVDKTSAEAYEEVKVEVSCEQSELSTLRQGAIEIKAGSTKKQIAVIQSAAGQNLEPFISIAGGNSVNIDADVLSFKVKVQSNVEYAVVIPEDVDWISTEPFTKALVNLDELELYTSANTVTEPRTATIYVANEEKGLFAPIVVTQGPAEPSGETTISWVFSADAMSNYKDAFEKSNSLPATKGTGYISWVDLEENVAIDQANSKKKSKLIGATGDPYVTGVWVGDYWEFTIPGVTASEGATINFNAETRCSATGHKYWKMMYNVGGDWEYIKETSVETETGTSAVYTHIVTDKNTTVNETIKLKEAISNQEVKIRFICAANWQFGSGKGALAAPNGGTHRWSVTANVSDGPVITIKEPVPVLKAQWMIYPDPAEDAYVETFGGLSPGTFKNTAGDNGMYIDANGKSHGTGRITYVQVDKTSIAPSKNPLYIVGGTGHPYLTGCWPGDYWLFSASDENEYEAGTKLHVKYLTRISGTGQKYWMLECWDGEAWIPAPGYDVATEKDTGTNTEYNFIEPTANVEVNVTWPLAKACTQMQFRMRCVANWQSNGSGALAAPNGGTCRLAATAEDVKGTSPIFEVVD